ncbi:MAG: hypothetical protein VYA60_07770 [Pseudomonadota bacterium]|nr:hypothetical protein [Pseudomonadota bacterium]
MSRKTRGFNQVYADLGVINTPFYLLNKRNGWQVGVKKGVLSLQLSKMKNLTKTGKGTGTIMTKNTYKKAKKRGKSGKTQTANKQVYSKRKASRKPVNLSSAPNAHKPANDATIKPRRLPTRVAKSMFSERNPRCGKKSFFFGGEFTMPVQLKDDKMRLDDIVVACCKMAVHCNMNDTHWWAVYKYTDRHSGCALYSISNQPRGHGKSVKAGVIVIKKSDTQGMSESDVKSMIDAELKDYSDWLNAPMFLQA